MNDEPDHAAAELSEALISHDPVSLADIVSADVNGLTADIARCDRHAMLETLSAASKQEDDAGGSARTRVLGMLISLMAMHLRIEAEGDPFGASSMDAERRTALPADFVGGQAEVFAEAALDIEHPTLRARMADVAYEAGVVRAGRTAISAYCEIADRLMDGRAEMEFPDIGTRSMDTVKPLERCMMINARIARRGTVVEPLRATLVRAFDHALAERAHFPAATLGRRLLRAGSRLPAQIAAAAEHLADDHRPGDYQLAVKEVWLLAAEAHQLAGDETAAHAASVRAIEQTLAMADTVSQSSAKASWVKNALQEFRALGGASERVEELRRRLRDLQDQALDEFGSFTVPLDGIEDVRAETMRRFEALDLPDALRAIIGLVIPDKVAEIREQSLRQAREFPLSNLFAASYADAEGKEVARGPSVDLDDDPPEAWFKEHGIRDRGVVRRYRVLGSIEPARRTVLERFSVNEQHMMMIVANSSFVPAGHRNIFSLGFARMWQGDYATAGHLLVPQVENSLRHVLRISGRDAAKIEASGIEGDRPLNVLLVHYRAELEQIFGADMVWELDSLLNFRPGPALRHEIAHGKMPWNAFFSDEAITACWVVYLLTVAPLLRHWDEHVAPALATTVSVHQP